jgi:hypothetical protein
VSALEKPGRLGCAILLATAGCTLLLDFEELVRPCSKDSECTEGFYCSDQSCLPGYPAQPDASVTLTADAGLDAGPQAPDAAVDGSVVVDAAVGADAALSVDAAVSVDAALPVDAASSNVMTDASQAQDASSVVDASGPLDAATDGDAGMAPDAALSDAATADGAIADGAMVDAASGGG